MEDTIRALQGLMDDDVSGEIFNVGATNRISIIDLGGKVIESHRLRLRDRVRRRTTRSTGTGSRTCSTGSRATEKIRASIGWQPELTLEHILADVVAFESARTVAS